MLNERIVITWIIKSAIFDRNTIQNERGSATIQETKKESSITCESFSSSISMKSSWNNNRLGAFVSFNSDQLVIFNSSEEYKNVNEVIFTESKKS